MVQALSAATRGGNSVIHFSISQEIPIRMNVSRAEKLPLFPGYYFLMMSAFSGARAEQPFST